MKSDYRSLLAELRASGRSPSAIVHLWCLTGREENLSIAESYKMFRSLGFNSLLFLAQAIVENSSEEPVQIKVVSNYLHAVTGEDLLSPAKAILLGPCRVIPQEHPNIQCTNVDLGDSQPSDEYAHLLAKELSVWTTDPVVAYRGANRWIQTFERANSSKNDHSSSTLREGGVYLITGGLGGIGLVLAEYLAQAGRAKLVLISRTGLPDREEWQPWLTSHGEQNDVSKKILKVKSIENQGAEVLVLRADVADADQMKAALVQARDRFGDFHGVIHAAGVAGGGVMLLKQSDVAAGVMAPKVEGTLLLGELLRESKLDFFVLCSSITARLGAVGQVDYCSANAFLDAYAQKYHSQSNVISIAWSVWQEVGMAVNTKMPLVLKEERERSLRLGISPDEGKKAFGRILGKPYSQVIVSSQDVTALMHRRDKGRRLGAIEEMTNPSPSKSAYQRPDLSSEYVAPGNSIERTIAEIWQEFLGVANVGIHDSFFELGGHSLMATGLASRLRAQLGVELPANSLFLAPTIAAQAELIAKASTRGAHEVIVPIQKGSASKPPFFMIHSYHLYASLPRGLGSDQPVYGVEEFHVADPVDNWALESMMARYVEGIRAVQPHGPYFIGGYCSAALPAFEVARQLEEAGESVPLLVIIDTVGKTRDGEQHKSRLERLRSGIEHAGAFWRFHTGKLKSKSVAGMVRYAGNFAASKLRNFVTNTQIWGWRRIIRIYMRCGFAIPSLLRRKLISGIRMVTLEAIRAYSPKPYKGDIAVFLAADTNLGLQCDLSLWRNATSGKVQLIWLPGGHDTAFTEPNFEVFARELKDALDASIGDHRKVSSNPQALSASAV